VVEPIDKEIVTDGFANRRKRITERYDRVEFLTIAHVAPREMVPILLPSRPIKASRLHMSSRIRRNPHVSPRRRNRQLADPLECLLVGNEVFKFVAILKAACGVQPANTRSERTDYPQIGLRQFLYLWHDGADPTRASRIGHNVEKARPDCQ
jgi:hypothetical protein